MHILPAVIFSLITGTLSLSCAESPRYTRSSQAAPERGGRGAVRRKAVKPKKRAVYYQTGKASYYANKFHGRKTASGERYDRTAFTAAHRKLPFGTRVRVTNLGNGKSVTVRVNDRGPVKKSRVIDLSLAAAREIGILRKGIADVGIEIVK